MKISKGLLTVACILASAQFLNAQWTTGTSSIYYNDGNVGIGTYNPTAPLSLGNSILPVKLLLWEGGYGNQYLRTGFGINNGQFRMFLAGTNNRFSFLSDENGTNELMTILGTGNVGIGTINPGQRLSIQSASGNAVN